VAIVLLLLFFLSFWFAGFVVLRVGFRGGSFG